LGQVWHVVFRILVKPLLEGRLEHELARERNRAAALALARRVGNNPTD
jgi:hypothetical protein